MFLFKSLITSYMNPDAFHHPGPLSVVVAPAKEVGVQWDSARGDYRTYDFVKRILDLCGAGLLLILQAPILLFIALGIKLSSSGPIIFRQNRLTKNGQVFTMYKFRTMYADAESATGAVWAQNSDPRVTRLGRFLRVSRLDELPQLVNVLRGDMSLVGPRPERPEIADKLANDIPGFSRRLEVKAGITGLAQIANGYASTIGSYKRKIAYDIRYVDNRSLSLDMVIALRTIAVVLTGFGAK